ncbi:MAG: AMP-binding protein [Acidimicrobiia bacterium]
MTGRWELRRPLPEVAARYRAEGLWSDDSLGQLLSRSMNEHPGQTFRAWSAVRPSTMTYADLDRAARLFAAGLVRAGVQPGDVVSFQLPNWLEAPVCFLGAAIAGAVTVPIAHNYGAKEVAYILSNSGSRLHITADSFGRQDYMAILDDVRPAVPSLERIVMVDDVLSTFIDGLAPLAAPVAVDPDDPVILCYTSGTTADPKGAIHTSRSLVGEVLQRRLNPVDPLSVPGFSPSQANGWLVGSPIGHVTGLLQGTIMPIAKGWPVNLADRWDLDFVFDVIENNDIAVGVGATFFLMSVLDSPRFTPAMLDKVRYARLGGSPIPLAVAERCEALGISLTRAYGSTEHPSVTGTAHNHTTRQRVYTDGPPLAGIEIELRDAAGHVVSAPGVEGEVFTRGPDLFAGYTDPSLNEVSFDANGWFAMGDLGVIDDEGCLTITGRTKDIIIRGGAKLSAVEIEEVLHRMASIEEAVVVAVPDARLGEKAAAFVRVRSGHEPPTMATMQSHCEAVGLTRQKWPEELHIVDDFDRTPSGKVKKFAMVERRLR